MYCKWKRRICFRLNRVTLPLEKKVLVVKRGDVNSYVLKCRELLHRLFFMYSKPRPVWFQFKYQKYVTTTYIIGVMNWWGSKQRTFVNVVSQTHFQFIYRDNKSPRYKWQNLNCGGTKKKDLETFGPSKFSKIWLSSKTTTTKFQILNTWKKGKWKGTGPKIWRTSEIFHPEIFTNWTVSVRSRLPLNGLK